MVKLLPSIDTEKATMHAEQLLKLFPPIYTSNQSYSCGYERLERIDCPPELLVLRMKSWNYYLH